MIDKADGVYRADCDKCSQEYPEGHNDLNTLRDELNASGWKCTWDNVLKTWTAICAECMGGRYE